MDQGTINFEKRVSDPGGEPRGYSLSSGDILGQYRVVRALGRGGMGEVYEVEHGVLRRRYALKLLPAEFARSTAGLERFRREAQVMVNLEHPNIVRVDDFGEAGGRYWLRMELAEGVEVGSVHVHALGDYVKAKGGRLVPAEAEVLFRHILEGLGHAHSKGVVHRDLKPGNILLSAMPDGGVFPKISDFGLVRSVGEDWVRSPAELSVRQSMSIGGDPTLEGADAGSGTRSLLGTHGYMSPEQKRGEEATPASDVYAVGLMMCRLLTGRQLGMERPSELVPDLPVWWDGLVATALEDDPAERLADGGKFLERLGSAQAEEDGAALSGRSASAKAETEGGMEPRHARNRAPEEESHMVAEVAAERTKPSKLACMSPEDPPNATGAAERLPRVVAGLGLALVHIPSGSFRMGSDGGDEGEGPAHDVEITHPFWLGKYPVTQAEYALVMGSNPSHFQDEVVVKSGFLGFGRQTRKRARDKCPVDCVSWHDAVDFCGKLTERERIGGSLPDEYAYRLPTEAEWEYAARGGEQSRGFTYAGSSDVKEVAWCDGNSGRRTHLVGHKKPNEFGLYDMSGNVYEWCMDWYSEYPAGAVADPAGSTTGSYRVLRGGSWSVIARICRSAFRGGSVASHSYGYLGFRVALAPVR